MDSIINPELLQYVANIGWSDSSLYVEFRSTAAVAVKFSHRMGDHYGVLVMEAMGEKKVFKYKLSEDLPEFMKFYYCLETMLYNKRIYQGEVSPVIKNFTCLDRQLFGLGEYF